MYHHNDQPYDGTFIETNMSALGEGNISPNHIVSKYVKLPQKGDPNGANRMEAKRLIAQQWNDHAAHNHGEDDVFGLEDAHPETLWHAQLTASLVSCPHLVSVYADNDDEQLHHDKAVA